MNVDITTTCTLRPHIYDQSLKSVKENIIDENKSINFRIIANIDPIGDKTTQNTITKIIKKYHNNYIVIKPTEPNFPLAVKNVWNKCTSDYVFHIEDDILFKRKINLTKILELFSGNVDIVRLQGNLRKLKSKYKFKIENKGWYNIVNNNKKLYPSNLISLTPSIFRVCVIGEFLSYIRDGVSPEWTLMLKDVTGLSRDEEMLLSEYINSLGYIVLEGEYWKDIGRVWRKLNRIVKPKKINNKMGIHKTWIKRNDSITF